LIAPSAREGRRAKAGLGGVVEGVRAGATLWGVTAKEKLLERVPKWSEHDAEVALRAVEGNVDPAIRRFEDAPLEDEEISAEEEAAVQEARDELAAGVPKIPLAEIKRKHGLR
jgi:hypothetical protein